jgi:hypothetical protein
MLESRLSELGGNGCRQGLYSVLRIGQDADFDVVVVPLIGINTMVILFELALG